MSSGLKNVNFRCVIWTKEIFFWQSDIFERKVNSFIKPVKEVSPQIAILESAKSGREKLIFSRFMQKQHQIHDGTKID